eukprot:403367361
MSKVNGRADSPFNNQINQSKLDTSSQLSKSPYQPKFIKKKPQNIASIDSAKELSVSNFDNQNSQVIEKQHSFTDKPVEYPQSQSTSSFNKQQQSFKQQDDNINDDEKLINQMMEELKRQKLQQQQQLQFQLQQNQQKLDDMEIQKQSTQKTQSQRDSNDSQVKQEHLKFQVDHFNTNGGESNQVYQDSTGYVSLQQRSDILNITQSPKKSQNGSLNTKENQERDLSEIKRNGNSQDYDEIKRKKIDELKKVVMQETNQQFNTIQNQPPSKSPIRVIEPNKQQQATYQNVLREQYSSSPMKMQQNTSIQLVRDKTPTKESIQLKSQNSQNQRQFPRYNPILENKSQLSSSRLQNFDTSQTTTAISRNKNDNYYKTQTVPLTQSKVQPQKIERDISQNRVQQTSKTVTKTNSQVQKQPVTSKQSQKQLQTQNKSSTTPKASQQQIQSPYDNSQNPNTVLISEKTQQIYFKKLQKEVEVAIRDADQQEKGGIDIEEFKQCFYNLNYLPYMNPSNNFENTYSRANDHTYQTTLRGLIIQEKEFVYNLWSVLNPLDNQMIDNAMLYDVLLLLIYNVKSAIPTTAGFLTEYLENHYNEEGVDLQIFQRNDMSNRNNNNSTLGSFDIERDQEQNLTLLNKYLTYNNLWSIERIAMEFKQIHANKVSYTQTLRQRSPSPMGASKNPTLGLIDPEIVATKKFKPQVINDYLSQLTFSPNLGSQTKKIDQQLTQKLTQENQAIQGLKRDTSADNVSQRNPYSSQTQTNSQNANLQNMSRYELLFYRQHLAEQKIEKAKENLINKELEECSFKPNISRAANTQSMIGMQNHNSNLNNLHSKTYQNLKRDANQIFQDLSQKIKNQKQKYEDKNAREEKELEQCTFKPNLTSNNAKRQNAQKPLEKIPKGYYEQINRMRKTNEEKKAQEEKQKKKETGENYERTKQMNVKPPSFIDKQREKRKLIMYVDVNITPTKTGRIGIYEGDSIKDLARNFQKAFQLNNNMLVLLMHQLEQHLINYKEKHGIIDDNRTYFPKSSTVLNQDLSQTFNNPKYQRDLDTSPVQQDDSNQKSRNYEGANSDLYQYKLKEEFSMPTFDQKKNSSRQQFQEYRPHNDNDHLDEEGVNVNLEELDEVDLENNQYLEDNYNDEQDYSAEKQINLNSNDDDENERLNNYVRQEIERYDRLEKQSQQRQYQMLMQDDQINSNTQFENEDEDSGQQQIYQLPGFGQHQSNHLEQNYANYDDSFNQ